MKQSLLLAALAGPLVCVLPLHAIGQAAAQDVPAADPPRRVEAKEAGRASAALPARAGTRPMPERGTVAPANKVPAHVESAASRAMAAAAKKNSEPECEPAQDGKKD